MRTASRRSPSFHIPGFSQNAVLQLIVASGTCFILYKLVCVSLIVFGHTEQQATSLVDPFVALHPASNFLSHFWTLFTYGWAHNGVMQWISNMVWLYCFGSALQMLLSYKHVIPVYIYGLLGGGIFCLLSQLIPGTAFHVDFSVLTGQAGTMALVAAIITLSPNYRIYFGEYVSIPMLVIAGLYVGLTMVFYSHPAILMLDAGGLLTGFLVMTAIKKGVDPGAWMYNLSNSANRWATPKAEQRLSTGKGKTISLYPQENIQKRIDEILDKINQRGYNSLSKEEKDLLVNASRDDK